jgi:hypothetical protein
MGAGVWMNYELIDLYLEEIENLKKELQEKVVLINELEEEKMRLDELV